VTSRFEVAESPVAAADDQTVRPRIRSATCTESSLASRLQEVSTQPT
jgi:hypothetical protein